MKSNTTKILMPLFTAFTLFLLAALPQKTLAAPTDNGQNDIKVFVNEENVLFDQPRIIVDGRTLVPLRAVLEKLGATVEWTDSTQAICITKDDLSLILTIGSQTMAVGDGSPIFLDVPPQIYNGRTLLPIRAVVEKLGGEVQWNAHDRIVTISYTENSSAPTQITPPPLPVVAYSIEELRQQLYDQTNAERNKTGAADIPKNDLMMQVAQLRAEALAELGYLPDDHNIPGLGNDQDTLAAYNVTGIIYSGENCAIADTTENAINTWLASTKGHRESMLDQLHYDDQTMQWTQIGVGVARDSGGMYYWVQIFAK